MEIAQLRSFLAVVEEGSIGAAARRVFLTQPAVSMQIRALETELKEKLFNRSSSGVSLTEPGRALLGHAIAITNHLDSVKHDVEALKSCVSGSLTIGCSDTFSSYILPNLLAPWCAQYEGIEISIRNRHSKFTIEMVLSGQIDIGFVTFPCPEEDLEIRHFRTYSDVAVCSPAHSLAKEKALTFGQLTQERLLLLEAGTRQRALLDGEFEKLDLKPAQIMEFGSVAVQKAFALHNLGVAIVPDFSVMEEKKHNKLCPVKIKNIQRRSLGLCWSKKRSLSPAAREFVSFLDVH